MAMIVKLLRPQQLQWRQPATNGCQNRVEFSPNQLKPAQVQIGEYWVVVSFQNTFKDHLPYTYSVLPCETTATATTTTESVTTSTILSSETSSMNVYEDEDGQEWRRGRTKTRSKSKQSKQPRPTSVCAALAEKEKPLMPNETADM